MISSMLVFARNFLGTLLREATRVCPAPKAEMCFLRRLRRKNLARKGRSRREIFSLETQTRRAFAVANEAEHRSAAGRGTSTERVTEGEQGKNWRNGARTKIVRGLGRLLKTHCRKPPTIQFSASPPSRATTNQRVKSTHTKPHFVSRLPRDRARHGRLRRWNVAASFRCRHGKQLRNAPHGSTADPARHGWHGGASFRCSTISWTAAMRAPIHRMTGTAIELPSTL